MHKTYKHIKSTFLFFGRIRICIGSLVTISPWLQRQTHYTYLLVIFSKKAEFHEKMINDFYQVILYIIKWQFIDNYGIRHLLVKKKKSIDFDLRVVLRWSILFVLHVRKTVFWYLNEIECRKPSVMVHSIWCMMTVMSMTLKYNQTNAFKKSCKTIFLYHITKVSSKS